MTSADHVDVARRRASGLKTRERILAAAADLFSSSSYGSVTVRDIAKAAQADPALVIRYFGSKIELFTTVRRPDFEGRIPTTGPFTVDQLTRVLVDMVLEQGTRVFDLTGPDEESANIFVSQQVEKLIIEPCMRVFALPAEQRVNVELVTAMVIGIGFMRQRLHTTALAKPDANELADLLLPHVASMLHHEM